MFTDKLVLGRNTSYDNEYAPSRLQRIERSLARSGIPNLKKFSGVDIWRLYEMTCLDLNGLPMVFMGIMKVPADSRYIVESKSLKLYELSYTMTKFKDLDMVKKVFERDLSKLLECNVTIDLYSLGLNEIFMPVMPDGICLEALDECKDLSFRSYKADSKLLVRKSANSIRGRYYTNLFRSLCPVTSQPDHATVMIDYEGDEFSLSGLLSYIVSLRNHQGFHEQCVELIYSDIMTELKPKNLTVSACFTRRGGIDINPVRTSTQSPLKLTPRTIRQ
ncbi:MAG: NADPH-dependent 7-cyano-7-deazaguanine reductase QueF [Succinivibrio sp.]